MFNVLKTKKYIATDNTNQCHNSIEQNNFQHTSPDLGDHWSQTEKIEIEK